jgi:hypothetical protein
MMRAVIAQNHAGARVDSAGRQCRAGRGPRRPPLRRWAGADAGSRESARAGVLLMWGYEEALSVHRFPPARLPNRRRRLANQRCWLANHDAPARDRRQARELARSVI